MSRRTRRQLRQLKKQEAALSRNTYLRYVRRHWLSVLPIVLVALMAALLPWSQEAESEIKPDRMDTALVVGADAKSDASLEDTVPASALVDILPQDIDFSSGALLMDLGAMLSPAATAHLDSLLLAVAAQGRVQVGLLTVPGMAGAPLEAYSLDVANAWALGEDGKDNGVMVLLSRKERKLRLEVGKGLSSVLTRDECLRIIDSVMVPQLKLGKVDAAVVKGMEAVLAVLEPGRVFDAWNPTVVKPGPMPEEDRYPVKVTRRYPWHGLFLFLMAPLFLFVGWKRSREGSFAWVLLPIGYVGLGILASNLLMGGAGILLFLVTGIHVVRTNSGSSSSGSDWNDDDGDDSSDSSSSDRGGSGGGSFSGNGGSGSW